MLHAIHWHPSEELLDEYVRQALSSEDAIVFVEEHLLLCERCREAVSETDDLVNVLRYAFSAAEEPC
jgi:predicted anti-sigma-YlaC factor YlaD